MKASPERESQKQARRREKAEAKVGLQASLPPDHWERFRILTDCISEARQVINLSDHRTRYALIIIGVLDAALFAVFSRPHIISELPLGIRAWLVGAMVVYGLLTLGFVYFAIEALRPRRLEPAAESSEGTEPPSKGLLYWEAVAGQDIDAYHKGWDEVRMAQVTREVETIFHTLSRVVSSKSAAMRRLYQGLVVLVIGAGFLLMVGAWLMFRQP